MNVADYLEKCGLYDQVFEGIDKLFTVDPEYINVTSDFVKEYILEKIDDADLIITNSSNCTAGRCVNIIRIELNVLLMEKGRENDRNDTLLHEVGHLIHNAEERWNENHYGVEKPMFKVVGRQLKRIRREPHGKRWKDIMVAIGGSTERCHNYSYFRDERIANAKHEYTCVKCGYKYYTARKLKNIKNRFHKTCGRSGKLVHKILY